MFQYNQWCYRTDNHDLWIKEADYEDHLRICRFDFSTRNKEMAFFASLTNENYRFILNYGMEYQVGFNKYNSCGNSVTIDPCDIDLVKSFNPSTSRSGDLFGHIEAIDQIWKILI